jgi:hypothetical protein
MGLIMNKEKVDQIYKSAKDLEVAFKHFNSCMGGGPMKYYLDKMVEYYEGCMKAAKYRVGDRVQLREDWNGIEPGWQHCKHFLKRGATAKIVGVDYQNGDYVYDIEFDNETWSDEFGATHPVASKHHFNYVQGELKRKKL